MEPSKSCLYAEFVMGRKKCPYNQAGQPCEGLVNPSEFSHLGYDTGHIGPWSVWQGNLDAKLVIVGQDWGDVDHFMKFEGKNEPSPGKYQFPSDRNLEDFLRMIGLDIGHPLTPRHGVPVFLTNAVLCLKVAGVRAPIEDSCRQRCGSQFLKPLIELIRPELVVTLGEVAYATVVELYQQTRDDFNIAISRKQPLSLGMGIRMFPVVHPGVQGMRFHKFPEHIRHWLKIGKHIGTFDTSCQIVVRGRYLKDTLELGNLVAVTLAELKGYPGSNPKQIDLIFQVGRKEKRRFSFSVEQATALNNRGLTSTALMKALKY